jgi:phosphoglucomutase
MVAREGKSVGQLLEELYGRVGRYITRRENISLSAEIEAAFPARVANLPNEIAGTKVAKIITIDGTKLVLSDGSWLLFRKSGTEPVVRLYGEAATPDRLTEVMKAGREFILKG